MADYPTLPLTILLCQSYFGTFDRNLLNLGQIYYLLNLGQIYYI